MQSDAMALFLGREALGKDTSQIFCLDPYPSILDFDLKVICQVITISQSEREAVGDVLYREHGMFGVTDKIDQDLQDLMLVKHDLRKVGIVPDDRDMMMDELPVTDHQRLLNQFFGPDRFLQTAGFGDVLLGFDDMFDMIYLRNQSIDFLNGTVKPYGKVGSQSL